MSDTPTPAPGPAEAEPIRVVPTGQMRTGAVGALALLALMLAGAVLAATGSWGGQAQNWLLVMLGVNAGAGELTFDALRGVRVVDVVALLLFALAVFGMRDLLGRRERVWVGIAAALPIAGILVLLVTGLAGRSALMAAGLVLAWRMSRRDGFRMLGWLGIAANGLLLVADFSATGEIEPAAADVTALGYVLLAVWLCWLAMRMLRPLRGRLVPVGVHLVSAVGGGCRYGDTDTTEVFDLPLDSRAEGTSGKYVGVADESTRFTVRGKDVSLADFLTAYDEADGILEVQVEEPGRLAAMTIERGGERGV